MLGGAAFIIVAFVGLVLYAMRVAPRMGRDSKIALDSFYTKCQNRDYSAAHAMFSQGLRSSISQTQLQKEWTKFTQRNGPLKKWEAANGVTISGFGGSVCVFPPFVDFRHGVSGTKGTGTLIYVRMIPEDGGWRLDRFNALR
jgi:hypothetical protein